MNTIMFLTHFIFTKRKYSLWLNDYFYSEYNTVSYGAYELISKNSDSNSKYTY
ncbi:MAG: hypothetical protein K0Q49_1192 [Haloplasmataceae bacterium]|jgi:hypothetical protein|nr:hypothetical protein [Haloplasmataceae bacterium]